MDKIFLNVRRALLGAIVFISSVSLAADFYWTGAAGDNMWHTAGNWAGKADGSGTPGVPVSGGTVYFCPGTFVDQSGETTVIVDAAAVCGFVKVGDAVKSGSVTIQCLNGNTITMSSTDTKFAWNNTAADCAVSLTLENFTYNTTLNPFTKTTAAYGDVLILKNCDIAASGKEFYIPRAGKMIVDNSRLSGKYFYTTGSSDVPCSLEIINGTEVTLTGDLSLNVTGVSALISNSTFTCGRTLVTGTNSTLKVCGGSFTSTGGLDFSGLNRQVLFDGVDFTIARGKTIAPMTSVKDDSVTTLRNTDFFVGATFTLSGLWIFDNSQFVNTNGYLGVSTANPLTIELRGKRAKMFPGQRFQGSGTVNYRFVVPVGGYDEIPVGCDGVLTKYNNNFWNVCSNGKIEVSAESPAARIAETNLFPLIYVYTGATGKQAGFAGVQPTDLPTEGSEFLVATNSAVAYADVMAKPESWWMPVATGYSSSQAGLAVRIAGFDSGIPDVASIVFNRLAGGYAEFLGNLSSIGETPEGVPAESAAVTMLVRKVGAADWSECPQSGSITAAGSFTCLVADTVFADPGDYEYGVRVENSFGKGVAYYAEDPAHVDAAAATVTKVSLVGEGVSVVARGTVTGTGRADVATVVIEQSEDPDFASGVIRTNAEGSYAAGENFMVEITVTPGVCTYVRAVVSAGGSTGVGESASIVPRTTASLGTVSSVNTNGMCRVVVDGVLTERGANDSAVYIRWSTDEGQTWTTNLVASISGDGEAFQGEQSFAMHEGIVTWQVLVRNTSGEYEWWATSEVKTQSVKDYSTYYWQDVNGEWDGNWNDPAHWSADGQDGTMYPHCSEAKASFANCPAEGQETVVTLTSSESVYSVSCKTAGCSLRFVGANESAMNARLDLAQSNATNTFDGIRWGTYTTAPTALAIGEGIFIVNGAVLTTKPMGITVDDTVLYIASGSTLDFGDNQTTFNQKKMNVVIDDGQMLFGSFGQGGGGGGIHDFLFRGRNPRLVFSSTPNVNTTWQRTKYVFEIPIGGYESVPVSVKQGMNLGAYFNLGPWNNPPLNMEVYKHSDDSSGLIYEVSSDSPHLLQSGGRLNQVLFKWSSSGIARGTDRNGDAFDMLNCFVLRNVVKPSGEVRASLSLRTDADGEGKYVEYATTAAAIEDNAVITTVAVDIPSSNGLRFYVR